MRKTIFILLLALALGVAACGSDKAPAGGSEETTGAGDAVAGQKLFTGGALPAGNTCHSLQPGVKLVGSSLANIGAEAGTRASGVSAEDYLRQSITAPNADVVGGFAANVMPATYAASLSEQEINDLVAYMLTLK